MCVFFLASSITALLGAYAEAGHLFFSDDKRASQSCSMRVCDQPGIDELVIFEVEEACNPTRSNSKITSAYELMRICVDGVPSCYANSFPIKCTCAK